MRLPEAIVTELRENVERGASRLDQRRPNWYSQIDCKTLDLSCGCDCVLGQLYGFYGEKGIAAVVGGWVRRLVNGYDKTAARYGFDIHGEVEDWACRNDYSNYTARINVLYHKLDALWIDQIKKRLAA